MTTPLREPTLAETDALMAVYLQRQMARPAAPAGDVSIATLAQHLQAEGQRQGWTISDAEARACAQAVAVRPAEEELAPAAIAAVRPTWSRPRSMASVQRARRRAERRMAWGQTGYDRSYTWAARVVRTVYLTLTLGAIWGDPRCSRVRSVGHRVLRRCS